MHQNLLFTAIPIHRNLTTQSPMIFFTKKSPIIMGVISHEHKANPASVLLTLFQVRFFAFSSANNSSNAKNLLSKQHIYAQKFFFEKKFSSLRLFEFLTTLTRTL
jgi:hypothetical protein